jgi:hypothetical protein
MTLKLASVGLLAVVLTSVVHPQENGTDQAKDYAKLGRPGREHECLKALVGTWELTASGTGSDARGSAVYKSIFDGRFITEEVKVPLGQFTMEWMGIYGYDPHKKKYTAVWVDNMDTTTESGEATPSPTGREFNFRGEHVDPRSGKMAAYTWRVALTNDDALEIVMYHRDGTAKEQEVLRIVGRKAKTKG